MIDLENLDKYQVRDENYQIISIVLDPRPGFEGHYLALIYSPEGGSPFIIRLRPDGTSEGYEDYEIIEKPVIEYVNILKGTNGSLRFSTQRKAIEYATQHRLDDYLAVAVPIQVGLNLDRIGSDK